jgi:hypothetical protein
VASWTSTRGWARQYGFDQTYGYLHGQLDQYTHLYKNGDRSWHRNDSFIDETGHATDLIAGEALRFIGAQRSKPFFLWVAFSVPHFPLQEEDQWVAPYSSSIKDPSRRLYAGSVAHMDAAIGRITAALEKAGKLSENRDSSLRATTAARRSITLKWTMWASTDLILSLAIIDHYAAGRRTFTREEYGCQHLSTGRPSQAQGASDTGQLPRLVPTLAQLAGAKISDQWKLEGRNVWPLLTGQAAKLPAPMLYWNVGDAAAVLQDDWKLIVRQQNPDTVELFRSRSGRCGENQPGHHKVDKGCKSSGKLWPCRETSTVEGPNQLSARLTNTRQKQSCLILYTSVLHHINRDERAKSVHRGILLAVFTWLFLSVVSMFAFNDATVVLLFPFFPISGILSMVLPLRGKPS